MSRIKSRAELEIGISSCNSLFETFFLMVSIYSITPIIQVNWSSKPSGYAENPEHWIFL
jgi:hypothetical protein